MSPVIEEGATCRARRRNIVRAATSWYEVLVSWLAIGTIAADIVKVPAATGIIVVYNVLDVTKVAPVAGVSI